MTRKPSFVLVLVLVLCSVAACGKDGAGADWTKRKIETVPASAGDVAFTIDLPAGMRMKPGDRDDVEFDFLVDVGGEKYAKTPDLTITKSSGSVDTLDKYVAQETSVENWVRKDQLPDGYITSSENSSYKGKEDYIVHAYRKLGDVVLTCHARVTPWTRGATVKDKLPLVENMCLSIKLAAK